MVDKLTITIDLPAPVAPIIQHTFDLFKRHFNVETQYLFSGGEITIGSKLQHDIQISQGFIQALKNRDFRSNQLFKKEPLLRSENGRPDYLGTCAYMVNFLQEQVDDTYYDHLDRFRYDCSYQKRFDCVDRNLVLEYLIELWKETPNLRHLRRNAWKSKIFISHDVDVLVKSIWPDLKTAVKNLNIGQVLNLLFQESLRDQDAALFEKILAINSAYDVRSTFFWMVNQTKYLSKSGLKIANANYVYQSRPVQKHLRYLRNAGCEIGLHQSLGSSGLGFEKTFLGSMVVANRNHYLSGRLQNLWWDSDEAGIKYDCTAGFSEAMGFRNSYGLPIQPFDNQLNKSFDVIAVPLHIMEVSFMNADLTPGAARDRIKHFIERNKTDCVVTLLWHNNYFSEVKFGEWISVYKDVLRYCLEIGVESISLNKKISCSLY